MRSVLFLLDKRIRHAKALVHGKTFFQTEIPFLLIREVKPFQRQVKKAYSFVAGPSA